MKYVVGFQAALQDDLYRWDVELSGRYARECHIQRFARLLLGVQHLEGHVFLVAVLDGPRDDDDR